MLFYNTVCFSVSPHKHAYLLFGYCDVMFDMLFLVCLYETSFLGAGDTLTLLRGCGTNIFFLLGGFGGIKCHFYFFFFLGCEGGGRYFFMCVLNFWGVNHSFTHSHNVFVYCGDV